MGDSMDIDLQGILKKRSSNYNEEIFQTSPKKSMKRVRIELPVGDYSDNEEEEETSRICSPKKRRGLNNPNEISPSSVSLNNQNIIENTCNEQQALSQSNSMDEYNKKNRIIVTPRSSLISQKLKNINYNTNDNNLNNNNNHFLFGSPVSPQSESHNPSTEFNNQFSFIKTTSPLSIKFFNNNNNNYNNYNNNNHHRTKKALSASLSPPVELNSSLSSPNSFSLTFSSSLPTSFTFHSPFVSNSNSCSNNSSNSNNGFSFNYVPNSLNSTTISESNESMNKSMSSVNTGSENSLNRRNSSNSSSYSNSNVDEYTNKNNIDIDEEDDTDANRDKNSLLSQIARQSFEAEKKRYMQNHKNN